MMQEQQEINEEEKSDLSNDSSERSSHIFNSETPVNEQKDTSWKGLGKRYKRIWRGKLKDGDTKDGIRDFSIMVGGSGLLGALISFPSITMAIATAPVSMVLGMAGAMIVIGYNYSLDDFTNAHLGASVGVLISTYLLFTTIIAGGSIGVIIGSLLAGLWYIASLSVAAVGYGLMGRWMNSEEDLK